MRIGFASSEWIAERDGSWVGGGTLHYRFRVPASRLIAAGHQAAIGYLVRTKDSPRFSIGYMGDYGSDSVRLFPEPDVVLLQRYMWADLLPDIARAREAGQVIVNDVDDYFDGLPESNRAYWSTHPDPLTRARGKLMFDTGRAPSRQEARAHVRSCEGCQAAPRENREHYREIVAAGDAIFASTAFLSEKMRGLGPPVFLLRNALDLASWRPQPVRQAVDVRATWYGALGFRASGDFDILRACLPGFLRRDACRRFVYGGTSRPRDGERMLDLFGLRGLEGQVETRGGVPIRRVHELLQDVDVGLAPLEACEFNEAKSSLKGMEYAAAGVPFVASPSGEYRWFGQGVLATGEREWSQALERLADPDERIALAEAGRARAEETSIDRTWPGWQSALEKVAVLARGA